MVCTKMPLQTRSTPEESLAQLLAFCAEGFALQCYLLFYSLLPPDSPTSSYSTIDITHILVHNNVYILHMCGSNVKCLYIAK